MRRYEPARVKVAGEGRVSRARFVALLVPAVWGFLLGLGLVAAAVDGETSVIVWLAPAVATCCAAFVVVAANWRSAERSSWLWALGSIPASLLGPLAILLLFVPRIRHELRAPSRTGPRLRAQQRPTLRLPRPSLLLELRARFAPAVDKVAAAEEPKRALKNLDRARAVPAEDERLEHVGPEPEDGVVSVRPTVRPARAAKLGIAIGVAVLVAAALGAAIRLGALSVTPPVRTVDTMPSMSPGRRMAVRSH